MSVARRQMPLVFVESEPDGLECYSSFYPCTLNKPNSNGSDGDNNSSWQLIAMCEASVEASYGSPEIP